MQRLMFRQGDVLVIAVDGPLVDGAVPIARDGPDVTLAHGEVTHHRHRIRSPHAHLFAADAERYLVVDRPVELVHEEHAPIALPAGLYRVVRQREYVPERPPREIAD